MTNTRGKKTVVPASKKWKGVTSSTVTTEIRLPFLQFPLGPQEELFQILRARPLGVGRCIDWTALEQVHLADSVRALLVTVPWDRFFNIFEPTYLEFTLELCLTFQLQTVMEKYDDPGTVQFCLGSLVRQLSVPEFGVALGHYTDKFMEADNFPHLHHRTPPKESHQHRPLHDTSSSTLWATEHIGAIFITHTHRSDVPVRHLKYAPHKDDRTSSWVRSSSIPTSMSHR
ncbi:hypothetical protein GOBAR_AA10535 [Gossypium barbadense]|uniref:Uncharacterized protein n=1 Tax=Gossypium barbadense TaxID=3634 RepID=A0A2P5Y3G5_GOSBA|nr:hypothetical protein GOBAR_AA10535 [Gossypium barbadense]